MRIDLAGRRDAATISAMSRDLIETGLDWSWHPARVLRAICNRDTVVLKAVASGEMAGFAIMRFGRDEAHLDLLAVRPEHRRHGTGSALLRWLEQSALTAGISIVRLEVRVSSRNAMRFYRRMGYQRFRTVQGYYQGRDSAVQMARDLWSDIPIDIA